MLTCKKKEYAWNGEEKNKKKNRRERKEYRCRTGGLRSDYGDDAEDATIVQDTTAVLPYPDLPRQKGDVTCMPAGSLKREEGDRRGGEKSFRQCGCEFGGRAIQQRQQNEQGWTWKGTWKGTKKAA